MQETESSVQNKDRAIAGKRRVKQMRGTGKQNIAIMMAIILLMYAVPQTVYAATTQEKLNQAQQEKKETESQLGETQNELGELTTKTEDLKGTLGTLNEQLTQVSNNLEELEQSIADKEAEIETTGLELEEAKVTEETQYEAMKKRVQFLYESRDFVLLEMLFSSASSSDFLNRNDYIEQLSAYDKEQLTLYQETKESIAAKEAQLVTEKEELDTYKAQVEAEQSKVAGLVSQTAGSISNYQSQISETEAEMIAYENTLKEQEQTIAQLQKQLEEERRLSALAAQSAWRDISQISFADGDRYLLANLIYCEAGNQPYSGQVAVGAVVMNRVMSSVFPDTVVGVIYQNKQFSPVASGRLALALAEDHATAACYQAADEAMSGTTTVGNCLFFRTPIEGLTGTQIGGHIFY